MECFKTPKLEIKGLSYKSDFREIWLRVLLTQRGKKFSVSFSFL